MAAQQARHKQQLELAAEVHRSLLPSPLLVRPDRTVQQLESQNPLIGVYHEGFDDQPDGSLPLEPGDRLVFYTDGVTETADRAGRLLGTAGLAQIAAEAMSADLFQMADRILDQASLHQQGPPTDDKTLIVAEIK